MIDYSNPLIIRLRSIARQIGLTRPALRLLNAINGNKYEAQLEADMRRHIAPGDIIWDVGANIGYYSNLFSSLVGASGKVIAFEPAPDTFGILCQNLASCTNAVPLNIALSNKSAKVRFYQSAQSTTNSLYRSNSGSTPVSVEAVQGDSFSHLGFPNVIKIDVEGHELEVLQGMLRILASNQLRHIFLEIHFSLLAERDLPQASSDIVTLLASSGLHVSWLDPSHLRASRLR